jgi:hypothetical protein
MPNISVTTPADTVRIAAGDLNVQLNANPPFHWCTSNVNDKNYQLRLHLRQYVDDVAVVLRTLVTHHLETVDNVHTALAIPCRRLNRPGNYRIDLELYALTNDHSSTTLGTHNLTIEDVEHPARLQLREDGIHPHCDVSMSVGVSARPACPAATYAPYKGANAGGNATQSEQTPAIVCVSTPYHRASRMTRCARRTSPNVACVRTPTHPSHSIAQHSTSRHSRTVSN